MKLKYTLSLFLFFVFFIAPLSAKVIYVDADVIGGNDDGTSWQDSYSNFQDAITEAVYGDSIWVAEGVYFPTNDNNRDISFELKNGVKWFGGFQGDETDLSQRDYELNPTILSGDIGVQGDSLDNSYHVVYTISSDTTTILDGFLIKNGRAIDPVTTSGSPRNFGGGLLIDAMENDSIAEPKIINCTFQNNMALYGGGISLGKGYTNFHNSPQIINCNFFQNEATNSGGAINLAGGNNSLEDILVIENCIFQENNASFYGGAISLIELVNSIKFINCDFTSNYTTGTNAQGNPNGKGGAISYDVTFFYNLTKLTFYQCNFINNYAQDGGGININVSNNDAGENLELEIENSFFSNNYIISGDLLTGASINFNTNIKNQVVSIKGSKFINHMLSSAYNIIRIDISPSSLSANDNLNLKISDCSFIQNGMSCLGVRILNQSVKNKLRLSNTVFKQNLALGGIVRVIKSMSPVLNAQILNCTFLNNYSGINKLFPDTNSVINVSNTIFWEDLTPDEIFMGNAEGFNIHHSLLKSPDCLINGIDYCGDGMLYNLYPEFRDTMNNDFSLRSCSPAINQGENISIDTLGIFFDIEGNPRILDDAVDLGAYETQAFAVLVPQAQNVKCHGGTDGGITWVQHGTPPFIFEWDNGVTTGTEFTGLSAGNYSIAVMDADSCTDTFSITVNQPLPLEIMDTVTAATGSMNADGMIEVMPTGGVPNYQYLWSNGETTALVENLLPGIYTVTVTDANGCVEILAMEVSFMTAVNELDKKYSIQLIPNLIEQGATTQLVFDLKENAYFEVEIFNKIGQLLFSKKIEMGAGRNNYELPNLEERGLFFVKIKEEDGLRKVLKLMVF